MLSGLARVPTARIKQYTQEKYGGPDDIALVRTKTTVIFEPGLVMPVIIRAQLRLLRRIKELPAGY
jgi:hypothetical protein